MEDRLIKAIIEAILFISDKPVSKEEFYELLNEVEREKIDAILMNLIYDFNIRYHGLLIKEIGGGYQMFTRKELDPWIREFFKVRKRMKLSRPALETLAIIAYRQPINGPEIDRIRGVDSSSVLKTLLEKRLIKIIGRQNVIGRPFIYATTTEFLYQFGLKELSELPKPEEFKDFEQI